MGRINIAASVMLVILRLCIGWHFFIEGLYKIHSHQVGATSTNTPWTSAGFFRNGTGPLAPFAKTYLLADNESSLQRLATFDRVTMWSLCIAGALLLIGLFCRPVCFLLGLFLLSVTLIAPAVPGSAAASIGGHFVYINLHFVEMIALFALSFIPTGRWFGLDVLFVRRKLAHAA